MLAPTGEPRGPLACTHVYNSDLFPLRYVHILVGSPTHTLSLSVILSFSLSLSLSFVIGRVSESPLSQGITAGTGFRKPCTGLTITINTIRGAQRLTMFIFEPFWHLRSVRVYSSACINGTVIPRIAPVSRRRLYSTYCRRRGRI